MLRHRFGITILQIGELIGSSAHTVPLGDAIQAAKVRGDG